MVALVAMPLLSCTADSSGLSDNSAFEDAQADAAIADDSAVLVDSSAEETATDSTVADTSLADTTVADTAPPPTDTSGGETTPPADTAPIDTGADALGCPAGSADCSGTCRDLQADPSNCGACGAAMCAVGSMCASGSCACQPGLTACLGTCVDTRGTAAACGGCGDMFQCPTGKRCVDGKCADSGCPKSRPDECPSSDDRKSCFDTKKDPMHCGGCGTDKRCTSDQVCVDGSCEKYVVGVGCNKCPCAACTTLLMGSICCPAPPGSASGRVFCVDASQCPKWL